MTKHRTLDPDPPPEDSRAAAPPLERLERSETQLWRTTLVLLLLLAGALALISWDTLRSLPHRLEALPAGLVILVLLFGIYVWSKSRQVAELRGLIRGIERRASTPPSEKQLDQLFGLIARSQQGYRDLIDTFEDLLFALTLDGEIRAANRSFAELVDEPFSQVIGHRLDEFLDEAEAPLQAAAEKALPRFLERRLWSGVVRVKLKKSGAVRFFECALHAMVKDNQVVGLSGLARDITQQRETEARFTELFETLHEGVYFAAPDGRILDANPALAHILGFERKEELAGTRLEELYAGAVPAVGPAVDLKEPAALQVREVALRRKDGRPVICLETCAAVRDPSGRVIRYQGTLLDITQPKETEKHLHRQQEFARRLVDSFPDLIVVLDTRGRYTFVSPRAKELLGYAPEELAGQELGQRTHPEDRPAMLELYRELLAGRRTFGNLEYRTRHKQGAWRSFRAVACPLFDEEEKIIGVIASARDVTEVKRLEQQLIQSEKLAAMGQMIAGVAHELNNPLTAILGVSELLRERAAEDTPRRHLDLIHRQARRAADIVKDLLAFARPPAPQRAPVHLSEVVERTLQLHEHSLRKNSIAVDFVPDLHLPRVVGDPHQLIQVFLNLITNAEYAIREVRDSGTLRIRLTRGRERVEVTFQDDGPGIPANALPRLFDPFFTTKRPGRGTGLGLSISMAVVREHGGQIEARNLPSGGAEFRVSLPIASAEARAAGVPGGLSQEEPVTPTGFSLRGRSVLVVDDDEGIRELVQAGLSDHGLRVTCAASGEEALPLLATERYDAILCDLMMPAQQQIHISGQDIFERLQTQPNTPKPVFVFMSGDTGHPELQELLIRGGCRVIQKPFRVSQLLALLSEAVQSEALGESQPRASS